MSDMQVVGINGAGKADWLRPAVSFRHICANGSVGLANNKGDGGKKLFSEILMI